MKSLKHSFTEKNQKKYVQKISLENKDTKDQLLKVKQKMVLI